MRLTYMIISVILIHNMTLSAESWKIDTGAGIWGSAPSGTITSTLEQTLYFQDDFSTHIPIQNGYFYFSLRHPLPIIPNLRFEYIDISTQGESIEVGVSSSFFPIGGGVRLHAVSSTLQMQQYDCILFYNLLEKKMGLTFDVGLDLKYLLSDYKIYEVVNSSDSTLIPLLYVRGHFDLPVVDMGIEGDARYITDGSSTVYDLRVKINYTMMFIPVVHPGIELGYRVEQFTSKGDESALLGPIVSSETDSDIGFSGFYAGVTLKF